MKSPIAITVLILLASTSTFAGPYGNRPYSNPYNPYYTPFGDGQVESYEERRLRQQGIQTQNGRIQVEEMRRREAFNREQRRIERDRINTPYR